MIGILSALVGLSVGTTVLAFSGTPDAGAGGGGVAGGGFAVLSVLLPPVSFAVGGAMNSVRAAVSSTLEPGAVSVRVSPTGGGR